MPNKKNLDSANQENQDYGLYDPRTKTFETEPGLIDSQQLYDQNVQESEVVQGRGDDVELSEKSINGRHFAQDFYEYSRSFQDNQNGSPGVDEDYGIYNLSAEDFEGEDGIESPEEEALSVKTIYTLGSGESR